MSSFLNSYQEKKKFLCVLRLAMLGTHMHSLILQVSSGDLCQALGTLGTEHRPCPLGLHSLALGRWGNTPKPQKALDEGR